MFASSSEERAGDGPGASGSRAGVSSSRAAFCRFRQSVAVLGAKAARAGGDAAAAAAAAAREVTKDAVQFTTAVRDGSVGEVGERRTANKGRSQDETNGGAEEYWGSDYCTPV